jgi:hypothetical protein
VVPSTIVAEWGDACALIKLSQELLVNE